MSPYSSSAIIQVSRRPEIQIDLKSLHLFIFFKQKTVAAMLKVSEALPHIITGVNSGLSSNQFGIFR